MFQYAGDPTKYPVKVAMVDDADLNPATAATLGLGSQNLADRTAYLFQNAAALAENWQAPVTVAGITAHECKPSWDPVNGQWLFGGHDTGANTLGIVRILGQPGTFFTGIGAMGTFLTVPSGSRVTSVLKDPTDATTFYLAHLDNTAQAFVHVLDSGTGVYTLRLNLAGPIADARLVCFRGNVVGAFSQSSGPPQTELEYSPDRGVTWHPAASNDNFANCLLSASADGATLVYVGAISASTSVPLVATTTDGVAWTSRSFGGHVSGGDEAVAIAYGSDNVGPCWILCIDRAGAKRFLRSTDGSTWTDQGVSLTANVRDLVAIGPIWLATVFQSGYGEYLAYSTDGCKTWRKSQFSALSTSASHELLGAAPHQFAHVYALSPSLATFSACTSNSGVAVT